ncbi:hypothetical protein HI914_07119 [Erysiphe necator]|nr:hypothetical protein HI914_07119 [Erysiphe necator]
MILQIPKFSCALLPVNTKGRDIFNLGSPRIKSNSRAVFFILPMSGRRYFLIRYSKQKPHVRRTS